MKKIILLLSLIMMFSLVACTAKVEPPTAEGGELELTLEELAEFDGEDGRKAYVAVDGIIYDVTDSDAWAQGAHNGFSAGKDLTEQIKNDSPHGVSMLNRVPKVGKVVD